MDVFTELINQYLEKYACELDERVKQEIINAARKKIIRNIDDKIASMLPESKVAQLLVLLNEGSPSSYEVRSFIERSGISLEEIIEQECQIFFR